MYELYFFIVAAIITGTVLLVSLIELILTVRRRKAFSAVRQEMADLKAKYTEEVNELVMKDEATISEQAKAMQALQESLAEEKAAIAASYEDEIRKKQAKSSAAIQTATAKAKELEAKAKHAADEYLETRKKQVENELMDLVVSVSKKVLPKGISYEAHKELVMEALRDVEVAKKDA